MNRCVIIGKSNVGKTVFAIRFAEFLGVKSLEFVFENPAGQVHKRILKPEDALKELVSATPHQTQSLQRITVTLPAGKGTRRFEIVDTAGLMEGIHADADIRRAMAQTLTTVRAAKVILHLIDASKVGDRGAVEALGEVDYQVAQFAQMRGAYLILANKIDLPGSAVGIERIRREFVGHHIIPISALHGDGFKEVKRHVWRWL